MSSSQIRPELSYGSGGRSGHSGNSANSSVSALSPITILTPTSATTLYASPDSATQSYFGAKSEPEDGDGASSGGSVTATPAFAEPTRKKQKRNKPTLSCHECVERKTKASARDSNPQKLHICEMSFLASWSTLSQRRTSQSFTVASLSCSTMRACAH